MPPKTPKTLEAHSIPIPPQLAGRLKQALGRAGTGFDEGAFLQQLHYWSLNSATEGWIVGGVKWIYNSLKSWQQQFPWMSEYGLRKTIANLKKLGLIHTAQHWITSYKRVMFYRIDYERLSAFAGAVCDLITPRCVNSDLLDIQSEHTTYTDTSSNTSVSEQPVVVSQKHDSCEETSPLQEQSCNLAIGVKGDAPGIDQRSPASSGDNCPVQDAEFPELIAAVAQAITQPAGTPLPPTLKRAITQYPHRVQPAIQYLKHQQQKRTIQNPAGYLYQAIVEGWEVESSEFLGIIPDHFHAWYNRAKAAGLVIAATTIDSIHHTLHVQQGWVQTHQLMQSGFFDSTP
jgi:hypothetical protein